MLWIFIRKLLGSTKIHENECIFTQFASWKRLKPYAKLKFMTICENRRIAKLLKNISLLSLTLLIAIRIQLHPHTFLRVYTPMFNNLNVLFRRTKGAPKSLFFALAYFFLTDFFPPKQSETIVGGSYYVAPATIKPPYRLHKIFGFIII